MKPKRVREKKIPPVLVKMKAMRIISAGLKPRILQIIAVTVINREKISHRMFEIRMLIWLLTVNISISSIIHRAMHKRRSLSIIGVCFWVSMKFRINKIRVMLDMESQLSRIGG